MNCPTLWGQSKAGLFTFRAEGNNDRISRDYSGKIHWPGISYHCTGFPSGVTIGRGYASGSRSRFEVLADLLWAGVSRQQAERIAEGSGLRGCQAAAFVRKNKQDIGEITESQQRRLFEKIYPVYNREPERIIITGLRELRA